MEPYLIHMDAVTGLIVPQSIELIFEHFFEWMGVKYSIDFSCRHNTFL